MSNTSLGDSLPIRQMSEPHLLLAASTITSSVTRDITTEPNHIETLPLPILELKNVPSRRSPGSGKALSITDMISPEPELEMVKLEPITTMVEISIKKDDTAMEVPVTSLKRTRSKVRLSMTSDGAARLLTGDESSPSPPRSELLTTSSDSRPNGLRRSFSAAGLSDSFSSGRFMDPAVGLRRMPSGRSRDSRAWEFWCDAEARNELVKKADQEQSGSAAAAISLMRSNSRGPLTPNSSKANMTLMRHNSVKRAKTEHEKPMLGRAKSSVARLQGETVTRSLSLTADKEPDASEKLPKPSTTIASPTGDSDKENWEPSVQPLGNARRRFPQPRTIVDSRRPIILGESRTVPSQSSSSLSLILHRNLDGIKEGTQDKENIDPEKDEEIASFMGKGRPAAVAAAAPSARAAGDDDMDCIQGLLSLSQGAWR